MGWIKIDDGFLDHPKYIEAGPLAGYLCLCAIAWSNHNRTDGFIPRGQVRRLVDFEGFAHHMWMGEIAGGGEDADAIVLAYELVKVGLWEPHERGYVIHGYLDWQRSKEEIEALTEQRREAGKKGGRARSPSASPSNSLSVSSNGSSSKSVSNSSSKTEAEVRSKKEETSTPPKPPASGGRKRTNDRFAEEMLAWARTEHPDLPPEWVVGAVNRLRAQGKADEHLTRDLIRRKVFSLQPSLKDVA